MILNPNYDLQRNKTKLKDRSDVIYKYKVDESVNEAYVVLYSPKKGVKPVTTAAYKDKKDAEKWAKDLGGITMIVKKKVKGIDEGKKRYYQKDGIGKGQQNTQSLTTMVKRNTKMVVISLISKFSRTKKI